jgi:hypothetical protein
VGNRFEVRLRAKPHPALRATFPSKGEEQSLLDEMWKEKKKLIEENIEKVKKKGFPNCFGYQRFGKGYKNFWEAKEVINSSSGLPRSTSFRSQ